MPAHKVVSHDEIIKVAMDILRQSGSGGITARNIAQKLGCSTQPLYRIFGEMSTLELTLEKAAQDIQASEVNKYMQQSKYPPYMAYGLGLVTFAKKEKRLFRYLYMSDRNEQEQVPVDMDIDARLKVICDVYGYEMETAKKMNSDMTIYCYGLALGVNTGTIDIDEAEIAERLHRVFQALTELYGKPRIHFDDGIAGRYHL